MKLTITGSGRLGAIARQVEVMAGAAPREMATVLNSVGPAARSLVIAAETKQTGLKRATIVRALKERRASAGDLSYRITSQGGNIRAKFFTPVEADGGVVAKPWGMATTYASAFTMGGRLGNRVALRMGGEVLQRAGKGRGPIRTVHSGVLIPEEMTKGETLAAFEDGAANVASTVVRVLGQLMPR